MARASHQVGKKRTVRLARYILDTARSGPKRARRDSGTDLDPRAALYQIGVIEVAARHQPARVTEVNITSPDHRESTGPGDDVIDRVAVDGRHRGVNKVTARAYGTDFGRRRVLNAESKINNVAPCLHLDRFVGDEGRDALDIALHIPLTCNHPNRRSIREGQRWVVTQNTLDHPAQQLEIKIREGTRSLNRR